MEGYISEVRIFAGDFAPRGWQFCNGAQMSIANFQALYVLIGTTYGGDGVNTFNLPDLRGRVPIGTGQGPGLPNVVLGQISGTESVTMTTAQMPAHIHGSSAGTITIPVFKGAGNTGAPAGHILGGLANAYSVQAPDNSLKAENATVNISVAGGSTPFNILQPYLTTNYIICVEGIFPSRN